MHGTKYVSYMLYVICRGKGVHNFRQFIMIERQILVGKAFAPTIRMFCSMEMKANNYHEGTIRLCCWNRNDDFFTVSGSTLLRENVFI